MRPALFAAPTEPWHMSSGSRGKRDRVQTYEIHCGGRVVSSVRSYTARHAVTDYLRSLGCPDDEMESVSGDQVAWRGAVYSGVATTEPSSSTKLTTRGLSRTRGVRAATRHLARKVSLRPQFHVGNRPWVAIPARSIEKGPARPDFWPARERLPLTRGGPATQATFS